MSTKTKKTWQRRAMKAKKMGKVRKAALANKGTTPVFPIHTPEIDAAAPAAQVSPKKA